MKKKDIIVVAICALIIVGSIYFIVRSLNQKPQEPTAKSQDTVDFTGEIDEGAIEKLRGRKDYGSPPMNDIGRENPFASL